MQSPDVNGALLDLGPLIARAHEAGAAVAVGCDLLAMALVTSPNLIVLDEPTSALDLLTQANIMNVLKRIKHELGTSFILITHDIATSSELADEVAIMYAGQIVEEGTADDVFYRSAHPYTLGLRAAMPGNDPERKHGLKPIEGTPPDMFDPPKGCSYFARCPYAMRVCENNDPPPFEQNAGHSARCWLHHKDAPNVASELFRGQTT